MLYEQKQDTPTYKRVTLNEISNLSYISPRPVPPINPLEPSGYYMYHQP
jgi:hypothetical protein